MFRKAVEKAAEVEKHLRAQKAIIAEVKQKGEFTLTDEFCDRAGLKMGVVIDVIGTLVERGIIRRKSRSAEVDAFTYEKHALPQRDRAMRVQADIRQIKEDVVARLRQSDDGVLFFREMGGLARDIGVSIRMTKQAVFSLVDDKRLKFVSATGYPRRVLEHLVLAK